MDEGLCTNNPILQSMLEPKGLENPLGVLVSLALGQVPKEQGCSPQTLTHILPPLDLDLGARSFTKIQ